MHIRDQIKYLGGFLLVWVFFGMGALWNKLQFRRVLPSS